MKDGYDQVGKFWTEPGQYWWLYAYFPEMLKKPQLWLISREPEGIQHLLGGTQQSQGCTANTDILLSIYLAGILKMSAFEELNQLATALLGFRIVEKSVKTAAPSRMNYNHWLQISISFKSEIWDTVFSFLNLMPGAQDSSLLLILTWQEMQPVPGTVQC